MKRFNKVLPKPDFPSIDAEVLAGWQTKKIFEKSQSKDSPKGNFVFYEGPPTANGKPGVHHVIARVFKDIIPRFKTMQGYRVDRKGGWDTHGLPVELEVERNLGISGKKQIEEYGVEKFNKKCRESVWKFVKEFERLTTSIGYWVDMENSYVTYDPKYIQSLWWILGEAWKKDLLYEGYKVVPYCPRCGTALSSHEVAQGYKDVEENTIYVKFPISGLEKTYYLAWTTTPWTLPGNSGLALGPNIKYGLVESEGERFVLALELVEKVFEGRKYKIITEALGKDLVEMSGNSFIKTRDYEPLFVEGRKFRDNNETEEYKTILGDFVSTKEGTGVVHIAPAFGEDDYTVGRLDNMLSVLLTVDEEGKMKTNIAKGKFVKDADDEIRNELKKRNLVFKEELYTHAYPFCWRCSTPLIYYAKNAWYIRMSSLREDLVANNEEIHWYPAHIKKGRFGEWVREAKDWALSRERYWGTPLPIWYCDKCEKKEFVTSFKELGEKSGQTISEDFDPHRPYIDEFSWACSCGGKMKRYPLVLDCWYDSGAMPLAQWGYPYEKDSKELMESHYPADYICEAIDQTRGWFYTLLAVSTFLGAKPSSVFKKKGPPFEHVICLGHILAEDGQKMSKSKGNIVDPWDVLKTHGADALRWYMFSATTAGNPRSFSIRLVGEAKRFLVTFWNVYSFFVTYASVDGYDPSGIEKREKSTNVLDRWIISKKNKLIANVTKDLERYNVYSATQELEKFLDELSNWYIRRSRRRFWKSENDSDKISAYDTLYEVLIDFTRLIAPFMPFVSEKIYQNLSSSQESVHLETWPKIEKDKINEDLEDLMSRAREFVEIGLGQRNEEGIKVRQPLASFSYNGGKMSEDIELIIAEEVNVKKIIHDKNSKNPKLDTKITDELRSEGNAREIVRQIQELRKKAGYNVEDRIEIFWQTKSKEMEAMLDLQKDYIMRETLALKMHKDLGPNFDIKNTLKVNGEEIIVGLKKVS